MDSLTTPDLRHLTAAAIARGDHAIAADMIASMFAQNPNDPQAHQQWARLLNAKGERTNAVEAMRQAADLAPLNASMRVELAQMLMERTGGEGAHFRDATWVEARVEARRALDIQPDHPGAARLIETIEEQRLVDSLATVDRTPRAMLARTTPARQFTMPNTTARMASRYAIVWALLVLGAFGLLLMRVAG